MGPDFNDSCPYKKRRGHRDTHREGHTKMEVEIRVMFPEAKECLGPPEAGRGNEGFFPRAFRGNMAY